MTARVRATTAGVSAGTVPPFMSVRMYPMRGAIVTYIAHMEAANAAENNRAARIETIMSLPNSIRTAGIVKFQTLRVRTSSMSA